VSRSTRVAFTAGIEARFVPLVLALDNDVLAAQPATDCVNEAVSELPHFKRTSATCKGRRLDLNQLLGDSLSGWSRPWPWRQAGLDEPRRTGGRNDVRLIAHGAVRYYGEKNGP
jgi:hypothetical protein